MASNYGNKLFEIVIVVNLFIYYYIPVDSFFTYQRVSDVLCHNRAQKRTRLTSICQFELN